MIWNSLYFGLATRTSDPLERMKFVTIHAIVTNYKYDDGQTNF